MIGKEGLGNFSLVVVVIVVFAVVLGSINYYNISISGAGAKDNLIRCVVNPTLANLNSSALELGTGGYKSLEAVNEKCNRYMLSGKCEGWRISSSQSICVWNSNCGDSVINQPMEQCDGFNLGAKTCADYGYKNGTLSCRGDCKVSLSRCY